MPAKQATKKKTAPKLPTEKQMEKKRQADSGYVLAATDAMQFLEGRQQAAFNIARKYHLEPDDLFQEAYEILLTCLRDYQPVVQRQDGEIVSVQFTTFFGSRLDSKAKELRNSDAEYQARQAYVDKLSDEEKSRFRQDPPLLVQHLDQETPLQEMLRGEAAEAQSDAKGNQALRIATDSFFENKLGELIAREKDEKKRAILLHVKVGGVFSFQEIAYHFGVTDSRASQVLNELMDAFYVQRLIEGSLSSVAYDFKRLKFNDKRAERLIFEALENASDERGQQIVQVFQKELPELEKSYQKLISSRQAASESEVKVGDGSAAHANKPAPLAYEKLLTKEENKKYPLLEVATRSLNDLKELTAPYRQPLKLQDDETFANQFDPELSGDYPLLITQDGFVIDGWRRVQAAKAKGESEYLCIVRQVPNEADATVLRVSLNLRLLKPEKIDLYYAICTLADVGLSQQRIADAINLSRTNVLVYCKVKDKASPRLRALFEDEMIQITNAASCVDLPTKSQDELAEFIRHYGANWGKGSKFTELFKAVKRGKLDELRESAEPLAAAPTTSGDEVTGGAPAQAVVPTEITESAVVQNLQERVNNYEQSLQDSETWLAQREQVIANQTEALSEAQQEIEMLKRELQAAELVQFGDQKTLEAELNALRAFYGVTERLNGATHGLELAAAEVKKLHLRRKQMLELNDIFDDIDRALTTFRLTLHNLGLERPDRPVKPEKTA